MGGSGPANTVTSTGNRVKLSTAMRGGDVAACQVLKDATLPLHHRHTQVAVLQEVRRPCGGVAAAGPARRPSRADRCGALQRSSAVFVNQRAARAASARAPNKAQSLWTTLQLLGCATAHLPKSLRGVVYSMVQSSKARSFSASCTLPCRVSFTQ